MDGQLIQQREKSDSHTIITIKEIEQKIRSLYNSLEEMSVQQEPNTKKQNKIIRKIEELQQLKTSLYNNLSSNYALTQASVAEARNSLVGEVAIGKFINSELNTANSNLTLLQNERNNKIRMAEINNYYSSKYETQAKVMKTIVYFCIPILILGILLKKGLIPQNIGMSLIGILIGLGIVVVFLQIMDIMRRDNMVFDEYKFPFNPENVDLSSNSNEDDQPKIIDYTLSCAGQACCPDGNDYGTVWDDTTKQCVTPSYNSSDSEGFVGERCLQSSFNKPSVNINIFGDDKQVTGYHDSDDNFATF